MRRVPRFVTRALVAVAVAGAGLLISGAGALPGSVSLAHPTGDTARGASASATVEAGADDYIWTSTPVAAAPADYVWTTSTTAESAVSPADYVWTKAGLAAPAPADYIWTRSTTAAVSADYVWTKSTTAAAPADYVWT
ncbi:hypothetical protein P3T37_007278 [Kitasatospora sp. MAA4]|nr:hypothetical protein [Kitasatospora sp. MAA4]